MSGVYDFRAGHSPVLVSVPHDGREIPEDIADHMTAAGLSIRDTDWHVAELYAFAADAGASLIKANYSRYVVDLNRPANDEALYPGQLATGICPMESFAGEPLYADGFELSAAAKAERIRTYWQPYHDRIASTLDELRARHGYALLWDAHSIPSRVPRLFDGELPVLNLGSNDGVSARAGIVAAVHDVATSSAFTDVLDGRFRGGYITRHYGNPAGGIHALQLELAQRAYMDEATSAFDRKKAAAITPTLANMLKAFLGAAGDLHS